MLKSVKTAVGKVFWIKELMMGLPSKRSASPGETRRISERFKRLARPVTGISQTTESRLTRILIPHEQIRRVLRDL